MLTNPRIVFNGVQLREGGGNSGQHWSGGTSGDYYWGALTYTAGPEVTKLLRGLYNV